MNSTDPIHDDRPWGSFDVVHRSSFADDSGAESDLVVKTLAVKPGARLSYQSHAGRTEHWHILSGAGFVVLDGVRRELAAGDNVEVPKGAKHRIGNSGGAPLFFVEVSTGDVREDDITRYEDDFGRAS